MLFCIYGGSLATFWGTYWRHLISGNWTWSSYRVLGNELGRSGKWIYLHNKKLLNFSKISDNKADIALSTGHGITLSLMLINWYYLIYKLLLIPLQLTDCNNIIWYCYPPIIKLITLVIHNILFSLISCSHLINSSKLCLSTQYIFSNMMRGSLGAGINYMLLLDFIYIVTWYPSTYGTLSFDCCLIFTTMSKIDNKIVLVIKNIGMNF